LFFGTSELITAFMEEGSLAANQELKSLKKSKALEFHAPNVSIIDLT
jgi:hypothetical protein